MVKYYSNTLNTVFSALADPTRRGILEQLSHGESTVSELAEPFDMSLPAVSKHLRILEDAGLITRQVDGRTHRLQIDSKPMKSAAAWLDRYQRFWDERLNSLEKFLSKNP